MNDKNISTKRPKTTETIKEIAKGKGERAEQAREIIDINKRADKEQELKEKYQSTILKAIALLKKAGRKVSAEWLEKTSDAIEEEWITEKEEEEANKDFDK